MTDDGDDVDVDEPRQKQTAAAPPRRKPTSTTARLSACTECHAAKVKCDKTFPCSRCIRLDKRCVPHLSNQGKGRKRRRAKTAVATSAVACGGGDPVLALSCADASPPPPHVRSKHHPSSGSPPPTEDALCAAATTLRPDHYGLRYLIRSWVSFAFRRRSFALLAKASALASHVGITMDTILCGEGNGTNGGSYVGDGDGGGGGGDSSPSNADGSGAGGGGGRLTLTKLNASIGAGVGVNGAGPMDFLPPLLLVPFESQPSDSSRLNWSEIPPDLLSATGCANCCPGPGGGGGGLTTGADEDRRASLTSCVQICQNVAEVASVVESRSEQSVLGPILGDRWIFVREMTKGNSRYFVSPAFERDVASWDDVRRTWSSNEREVMSLFLPPGDKGPYARGLMRQISLHRRHGAKLKPGRFSTAIYVRNDGGGGGANGAAMPSVASSTLVPTTITVNVDAVICMKIVDLDRAFLYLEFLREEISPATVLASLSLAGTTTTEQPSDRGRSPPPAEVPATSVTPMSFMDLDELDDYGDLDDLWKTSVGEIENFP